MPNTKWKVAVPTSGIKNAIRTGINPVDDEPTGPWNAGGSVSTAAVGSVVPDLVGGLAVGSGPVAAGAGVSAGAMGLVVPEVVGGLAVGSGPVPEGAGVSTGATGLVVPEVVGGLSVGTDPGPMEEVACPRGRQYPSPPPPF
ncbi:hypothetical protein MHU86_16695 [Fragilaria crotonensis]|nr:hypothetical protein MHU86_16695 [Fragilaria crotonensis]